MTTTEIKAVFGHEAVNQVNDIQQIADALMNTGATVIVTIGALAAIRMAFLLLVK